ncbi:MAG: peptide chain release factor N(5)-glutamine methyltransferase [Patescibacteria group bacterium]|jgi:release factor glutamine methyltransferase
MTIKQALKNNPNISLKDKEIFLEEILQKERSWLFSHEQYNLTEKELDQFESFISRREKFEPVNYIIAKTNFYNKSFVTDLRALIPRPETEQLVEIILAQKKKIPKNPKIIEIGTGTGAISITLFHELKKLSPQIIATDISQNALDLASINANNLKAKIQFIQNDLLKHIDDKFDLIIANLPYIPHHFLKKLSPDIKYFEPEIALDGGNDGTELIRKLLDQAKNNIKQNSLIYLEIWHDQGESLVQYIKNIFPKSKINVIKDLSGQDRFIEIEVAG